MHTHLHLAVGEAHDHRHSESGAEEETTGHPWVHREGKEPAWTGYE